MVDWHIVDEFFWHLVDEISKKSFLIDSRSIYHMPREVEHVLAIGRSNLPYAKHPISSWHMVEFYHKLCLKMTRSGGMNTIL